MNFDAYLPLGLTMQDAITAMAGGAAFLTVYLVWQALLVRSPGQRRTKELATRREALRAGVTAAPKRADKRTESLDVMRRTVNWLKLLRGQHGQRTADRLAQAGWRSRDAIIVFLFMKAVLPIVSAVSAMFFLYALDVYDLPPIGKLAGAAAGVMLGFYAPDLFVRNAADKRRKALTKGMPDALDLMVICAEAGLSLDAALARVARETATGCPPLADEFELTSIELGFLPERRVALQNLANRTGLPAINALTNALMQTEKYGTPLAQSLRILASEMRNERLMKAEEKAARLPATLTVPMVMFILPSLFIVLIGPGVLDVIDGLRGLN
jgi:tight adherence protein C